MPGANIQRTRQLIDVIARRDLAGLLELTDPEVEWRSFFAIGEGGHEYRGHGALSTYVRDLEETWDLLSPDVDDLLDAGDIVVGIGRIRYRGKGSGIDSEVEAGWMFKWGGDGRLLVFRAFRDPRRALEAVGLEQP
jgi:ketosteroid isomerase-like protein